MGKRKKEYFEEIALTMEEAEILYCDNNWSMELVFKCLSKEYSELTLAEFSKKYVRDLGWNKIHWGKLDERRTTIQKTTVFKSDVRRLRNGSCEIDEDSFFDDNFFFDDF